MRGVITPHLDVLPSTIRFSVLCSKSLVSVKIGTVPTICLWALSAPHIELGYG